MTCSGCVNAVSRVLNRLDGVTEADVSLDQQKARVKTDGSLNYQKIHDTIAKTGKKINYGRELQ